MRSTDMNPPRTRTQRQIEALRDEVHDEVAWWHTIDLGDGIVTPGRDETPARWPLLGLPESLAGLSVLDVGAWDGYYSFEAERRGAARVVAADEYAWKHLGSRRRGFDIAHRALRSKVKAVEVDVMDLTPKKVGGTFDLVLFLGVLYHLRDPITALERVASVTGDTLVLETHVDLLGTRRPAAAFYPGGELYGDTTNWWGPNVPALLGMLRVAGFDDPTVVHLTPRRKRLSHALGSRIIKGRPRHEYSHGRVVVHARRAEP
jgi:tRNA (mo5U34)-methyltransferase